MSLIRAFDTAFKDAERKGWDYIYVFMDLHSTLIKPNYTAGDIPTEFYDGALEGLKLMNDSDDMKLVMYTCSHPHEIQKYVELFEGYDIKFDYINENPEVTTTPQGYGCYDMKPYFNVLFDDKAGFYPEEDWDLVNGYLRKRYDKASPERWMQNFIHNMKGHNNPQLASICGMDEDKWNERFPEVDYKTTPITARELIPMWRIAGKEGLLIQAPAKPFFDKLEELQRKLDK